jgi:hypothetical protein
VAPPKRKTGGRVTPSSRVTPGGSRVDQRTGKAAGSTSASARAADPGREVTPSRRYTPPVDKHQLESPPWVPALMLGLFVVGGLAIMSRYLIWEGTNIPMIVGLGCLLGGLYTATKWR